jgi:hypothetical protein
MANVGAAPDQMFTTMTTFTLLGTLAAHFQRRLQTAKRPKDTNNEPSSKGSQCTINPQQLFKITAVCENGRMGRPLVPKGHAFPHYAFILKAVKTKNN